MYRKGEVAEAPMFAELVEIDGVNQLAFADRCVTTPPRGPTEEIPEKSESSI
jgi:hypothetical protein